MATLIKNKEAAQMDISLREEAVEFFTSSVERLKNKCSEEYFGLINFFESDIKRHKEAILKLKKEFNI